MKSDVNTRQRRTIRLQQYDYSQAAAYFVTTCAYQRQSLFGSIVNEQMALNVHGRIVTEEWWCSAEIRQEIELDAFVVMPNHIHGIVVIAGAGTSVGATGRSPLQRTTNPLSGPAKRSLGSFIAGFKSACTKRINEDRALPDTPVWQRNYYEHITITTNTSFETKAI
jgi:putative transposase